MKTLAFFALNVIATAALAVTPAPDPEINISGTSIQAAVLTSVSVNNTAGADAMAQQNIASNAGNVDIGGTSLQLVFGNGGNVTNSATGDDAYASQNLSSNVGNVDVGGTSLQITALVNSSVNNTASGGDSKAVQNIASNNACYTCQPSSGGGWKPKY